jgi:nicotine blue oxidoreductase
VSVAGLVLAAGGGRRYGGPKALVRHEGSLLVERAVHTVRDGGCEQIVVVIGAAADEVRATAHLGEVTLVENKGWKTGMGSSLKVGLDALGGSDATYGSRRGHPVLLGRDHWAGVAILATGDIGARAYLSARSGSVQTVPCEDIADDTDMDVPETAHPA